MNAHLSNEQLFELLNSAGLKAAPSTANSHLDDCSTCRSEFETLRHSLGIFRLAATSFAEQHAPAQAPARPMSITSPSRRLAGPAAWAAGFVAAAALCTAGVTVAHKHLQPAPAVARVQPAAQKPTVSDEDATLLEGIDRDLSTSVPPSLQPLDVTSAGETTSTPN